MACWAQLEFSEAVSPVMLDFIKFHDHIMLILIFILSYVGLVMLTSFSNSFINVTLLEQQSLETIWTLIPVFILLYIGGPSLFILYSMDYDYFWNDTEDFFNLKITGHQWYWSYEELGSALSLQKDTSFSGYDSYMTPLPELQQGGMRLLEVDNRVVVPCNIMMKLFVTAADVLHSWTIPSLGVKLDACPGRLNQAVTFINRPGVFYGQCSEICGANHSFMPICAEARFVKEFLIWSESK